MVLTADPTDIRDDRRRTDDDRAGDRPFQAHDTPLTDMHEGWRDAHAPEWHSTGM
jgi:hypothetical protein